jgi:hypothetical protein
MTPAAAFELRSSLLRLYDDHPLLIGVNWSAQEGDAADLDLKALFRAFREATVILWRPDLWAAAHVGAHSFIDTMPSLDVQGAAPQLWFLDGDAGQLNDAEWKAKLEVPAEASLYCIGLTPATVLTQYCLVPVLIYTTVAPGTARRQYEQMVERKITGTDALRALQAVMPHWRVLASQPIREPIHQGFYWIAAPLTFMSQEFVGRERQRHADKVIKQCARKNQPLPDVYTIQIRRSWSEERKAADGDSGRDWSCSWIVSGHWRKQWYPKAAEWRPKYIHPYAKGDPDKPLREPKGTVYVVSR